MLGKCPPPPTHVFIPFRLPFPLLFPKRYDTQLAVMAVNSSPDRLGLNKMLEFCGCPGNSQKEAGAFPSSTAGVLWWYYIVTGRRCPALLALLQQYCGGTAAVLVEGGRRSKVLRPYCGSTDGGRCF